MGISIAISNLSRRLKSWKPQRPEARILRVVQNMITRWKSSWSETWGWGKRLFSIAWWVGSLTHTWGKVTGWGLGPKCWTGTGRKYSPGSGILQVGGPPKCPWGSCTKLSQVRPTVTTIAAYDVFMCYHGSYFQLNMQSFWASDLV